MMRERDLDYPVGGGGGGVGGVHDERQHISCQCIFQKQTFRRSKRSRLLSSISPDFRTMCELQVPFEFGR